MAALVYPGSLPCPQRATYQRAERRALSTLPGQRRARALWRDRLGTEPVQFLLTFQQVAIWLDWFDNEQLHGGAWFAAPWRLPSGRDGVYRFSEPPSYPEFVAVVGWRVTAVLEVRGRGMPPQSHAVYHGQGWNRFDTQDGGPPFLPFWTVSGDDDEIATHDSGTLVDVNYGGIRAVDSHNAGKLYIEIELTDQDITYPVYIGMVSGTFDLGANPGSTTPASGQYVVYYNVGRIMSDVLPLGPVVTPLSLGDTVGVAIDFGTATVTMYRNGVLKGTNTYDGSGSPSMYPFISSNVDYATIGTLRTTQNKFQFPIPVGYEAWG